MNWRGLKKQVNPRGRLWEYKRLWFTSWLVCPMRILQAFVSENRSFDWAIKDSWMRSLSSLIFSFRNKSALHCFHSYAGSDIPLYEAHNAKLGICPVPTWSPPALFTCPKMPFKGHHPAKVNKTFFQGKSAIMAHWKRGGVLKFSVTFWGWMVFVHSLRFWICTCSVPTVNIHFHHYSFLAFQMSLCGAINYC